MTVRVVAVLLLGCAGAAHTEPSSELGHAEPSDIGLTIETLSTQQGDSILLRLPAKVQSRLGLCGFDLVLDPDVPISSLGAALGTPDCDLDAVVFTRPPPSELLAAIIRASNWATSRFVRIVSYVGWSHPPGADVLRLAGEQHVEVVELAAQTSLVTNSGVDVAFRSCCIGGLAATSIGYAGRRVLIWDRNECVPDPSCQVDADVSIVRSPACADTSGLERATAQSRVVIAPEVCHHGRPMPATTNYDLQLRISAEGELTWLCSEC